MNQNFLELIQISLGKRESFSHVLSDAEWNELYGEAEKQSLIGICFSGIERLSKSQQPDLDLLMDWLGQMEYQKTIFDEHKKVLIQVHKLHDKNCFKHVFMKGLTCGCRYPQPELRTCGDIDFVLEAKYFKAALQIMQSIGTVDWDLAHEHHGMVHVGDITVEPHYKVHNYQNSRNDEEMKKMFSEVFPNKLKSVTIDGESIPVFPPEFEGMFLVSHMVNHVYEEGLGLRQVMDFYYWLEKCHTADGFDIQLYEQYLTRMNMTRAARIFTRICEKYLGLSATICSYQYTDKELRFADKMLEDIMHVGNFAKTVLHFEKHNYWTNLQAYWWTVKRCLSLGYLCPSEAYSWPTSKFTRFFDRKINPQKYKSKYF